MLNRDHPPYRLTSDVFTLNHPTYACKADHTLPIANKYRYYHALYTRATNRVGDLYRATSQASHSSIQLVNHQVGTRQESPVNS
jgi:hypothetical protein